MIKTKWQKELVESTKTQKILAMRKTTQIRFTESRDHCHLMGENGGAGHPTCNLINSKGQSSVVSNLVHNFSKNDFLSFIKTLLSTSPSNRKCKLLSTTLEITISLIFAC